MSKATKLLALAESDSYNYLLSQMTLCAKRGCVGMGFHETQQSTSGNDFKPMGLKCSMTR